MYIWPFSLVTSVILLSLGTFVILKNRRSVVNASFYAFAISVFVWLFSYSFAYRATNDEVAKLLFQMGYMGVIFIPVTWFDFTLAFLNIHRGKVRVFIRLLYLISIVFLLLNFLTNSFIVGLNKYSWGSYPDVNPWFHAPFLAFFVALFSASITCLLVAYLNVKKNQTSSIQANRIKYVFWSTVIGPFASIDFLPNYGIAVYPIGFMFMFTFSCITAVSIIKYRLLEISLIFTRTSIFLAVYSLVLGIPFALAFLGQQILKDNFGNIWWIIPLISSTVLATIGPSIYLFIQKKAEDRLLQEQRQYQATLRKASLGMGQIKDLKRLLTLIVHVVTKAVRIEHCEIFLFHEASNQFVLKATKNQRIDEIRVNSLDSHNTLIQRLNKEKEPIVYQEVKQKTADYNDEQLASLEKILRDLNAELVVPSFIERKLIALIVLGRKRSSKMYTQDDLVVFSILASQSALAIENAMFHEETKRTHEQLFKAEKMATIGTMADGLSHQINNRLHAMGFIAGDAIDTLKRFNGKPVSEEVKKVLADVRNALERIEDNVKRGGEIVQGLLTYTRKGEEGFSAVDLNKLLDAAIEMASFKIKTKELIFHRNFDSTVPRIKGNFTQLQEVFFNIVDNSYDAIMQRKEELKESGFKGVINIDATNNGLTKLEITINDNGMGVKEDNKRKIFTPFFTTKLSSKKGTGLGMYVIKQIIEENHKGRVEFTSTYKEGSQTKILLPIYQGESNNS